MEKGKSMHPFSLLIGSIVVIVILWAIYTMIPQDSRIFFYSFLGVIFVFIVVVTYFSIKNESFRGKTFKALRKIGEGISQIGDKVIENSKESHNSGKKKKRVPIPKKIQDKVYDRADNRCQICGVVDTGMEIHHIDEDPANNNPSNLILTCRNDHKRAVGMNKSHLRKLAQKAQPKKNK